MAYLGNDLQVAFPTYRNIDDISGSFNGVTTSFPLTVAGVAPIPAPINSQQCLISVNGVVQRPDDSGAEGFRLSGGNIIFASAPAGGVDFFGVILAGADYVNIGANFPSGTAVAPSITFDSDLDTGIYNPAGNQIGFTTSGVQRLVINSSGQISGGLGTAAAPVISFISDPNTGIYSPGADQVAISTGGAGRLFVDASGNVGIGTSTSGGVLRVFGATGKLIIGDSNFNYFDANTQIFRDSSANERMRLDSSGRLGIGTSAPQSSIDVRGTASASSEIARIGNGTKYIGIGTEGTSYGWIQSFASTSLCLNPLGNNVGIGTTSPNGTLDINNGAAVFSNSGTYIGGIGRANGLIGGTTSELAITTSAAQGLLFGINNTERARIDSSGRLLVGTSSAQGDGLLQVKGLGNTPKLTMWRDNAPFGFIDGTAGSSIEFGASPSSGVFGIGASIQFFGDQTWGANDYPGRLVFSTTADGASSPTERMRIAQNGRIAFGGQGAPYSSATCDTYNNGSGEFAHAFRQDNATGFGIGIGIDGTFLAYFYSNKDLSGAPVGSISQNGTTTAYNTSSDYRLKENINAVTDGITRLQQLKPSRFNFIADPTKTVDGFLAHEVQDVVPEAITGEKDAVDDDGNPIYQGIDQSKLVPLLTAALQEAVAKIESLEARLTAAGI